MYAATITSKMSANPLDQWSTESILRRAAAAGNTQAMFELAIRHLANNEGTEARRLLYCAAAMDHTGAKCVLGTQLLFEDNPEMAAEGEQLLRQAADEGYEVARWSLARYLLDGINLEQDLVGGEKLLRKSAAANYGPALYELGRRLLSGRGGLAQDLDQGRDYLTRAIAAGDSDAMLELGGYLLDGKLLSKDVPTGLRLIEQAAALENSNAQRLLGQFLLQGAENNKDVPRGRALLRRAAETGDTAAMVVLGEHLARSERESEQREGILLLKRAAELECGDSAHHLPRSNDELLN